MKIWEPKPPGTLWVTPGLLQDSFTFLAIILVCEVKPCFIFRGEQDMKRFLCCWVYRQNYCHTLNTRGNSVGSQ